MKDLVEIAPRAADAGPAPLSATQERLWILEQIESGGAVYSEPYRAHLEGPLEVPALVRSLRQIAERHAILRATVAVREGRPVQVVAEEPPEGLPAVIDLSALRASRRRPVAETIATDDAARRFDLERGPLVRSYLIRLSPNEHDLLFNFHHLVGDGASIAILARELSSLYGASVAGRRSPLPALAIQYADFAQWQRDRQLARVIEEHLPHWERQLAGAPTVLTLPSDRPRRAVQRFRGRRQDSLLSKELLEALKALGQEEEATLNMTLLAASAVLLGRYTGRRDLLIGTPIDGRNRPELAGLIGFFVNTLIVRVDLNGDPTVRELLRRVRRATLDAYEHQELPFATLVETLRPERSPSHAPLFQVMLILEPPPVRIDGDGGLAFGFERISNATAKFDLTAILRESEAGLGLGIEYSTDLFDDSSIESVAQHFEVLYTAFAAGGDRRISTLPLLTAAEERQFRRWQGRRDIRPRGAAMAEPVTGLFEAQVAWTPEAPAMILGEESLSYRELNQRANRLAHYLRGLGVGPEVAVGIAVEPSPEMLVGVLGILKAGGAYVPFDPTYPRARLELMIGDTGMPVLLTQDRLADRLPASGARTIRLDAHWPEIDAAPADNPVPQTTSDHLAYQMFTSGSTGRPKGVMVTHRSLIHLTQNLIASYQLKEGDRVLMLLPLSFDASIGDLFPTILSGATLVLHPSPAQLAGRELEQVCGEVEISLLEVSASFWEQWVDQLAQRGEKLLPSTLRTVVVGGDSIHPEKVRTWFRLAPGPMRLFHSYGPTEATVCATSLELERIRKRALGRSRMPIGSPLPNVEVHVVDPWSLQPLPVGVPGEICISGLGVARGYLRRPGATAAVFVPHPWSDRGGARLYRTGDLGRWVPGGQLEFLGRLDQQVKIRGYRVEPGEIEAALNEHPALSAACVAAREDPSGFRRLVAWVVTEQTPAPTASALRAFLGERLPKHMVPSAFVVVGTLPLDAHGKVDRGALPEPGAKRPELDAGYVAPRDRTQRTITEIWQQVLGVERVGIRDNFFDLGGHSLLLIEVRSRLNEVLGREIPTIELFRNPTIEAQARHLAASRKAVTAVRPLKKAAVTDWFYLESWKRTLALAASAPEPPADGDGAWMILGHGVALADVLGERLAKSHRAVIRVGAGKGFRSLGADRYEIDPCRNSDYRRLFQALGEAGQTLGTVVHLWGLPADKADKDAEPLRALYSFLALGNALAVGSSACKLRIAVVLDGDCDVIASESIEPRRAMVAGPLEAMGRELPHLRCQLLDVAGAAGAGTDVAAQILAELSDPQAPAAVAYRHGQRWLPLFEPVALARRGEWPPAIGDGGTVLVTHWTQDAVFAVASVLARSARSRLVLLGPADLPPRDAWPEDDQAELGDDRPDVAIRRARELVALGVEVVPVAVDVADEAALRRELRGVRARFGSIAGVIHGVPAEPAALLRALSLADAECSYRAGIRAWEILEEVAGAEAQLRLLVSPLSDLLESTGAALPRAIHRGMAAIAYEGAGKGASSWISVVWDDASIAPESMEPATGLMTAEEAEEVLRRLVALPGGSRLIVSMADLAARIASWG